MKDYSLPIFILISVVVAGAWIYKVNLRAQEKEAINILEEKILPAEGFILPIRWGDLGARMIAAGVIDARKFESLYTAQGGLSAEAKQLLYGETNDYLKITPDNSGIILNLLWALGLSVKNDILEKGEMNNSQYGGIENFASIGGWTIAQDNPVNHYARHPSFNLTPKQQLLVEDAAQNIYRPCCDNPTSFPDCNHGIAMLGLLELMASQNATADEIYRAALQVNSFWFPDAYLTIAQYLETKGVSWNEISPKEILGSNYSSASGYYKILSQIKPPARNSGNKCSV